LDGSVPSPSPDAGDCPDDAGCETVVPCTRLEHCGCTPGEPDTCVEGTVCTLSAQGATCELRAQWYAYEVVLDQEHAQVLAVRLGQGGVEERIYLSEPSEDAGFLRARTPEWSPDGKYLVYTAEAPAGHRTLYWVDFSQAKPKAAKPVDNLPEGLNNFNAWSPDSKSFLVSGQYSGDLYAVRFSGVEPVPEHFVSAEGATRCQFCADSRTAICQTYRTNTSFAVALDGPDARMHLHEAEGGVRFGTQSRWVMQSTEQSTVGARCDTDFARFPMMADSIWDSAWSTDGRFFSAEGSNTNALHIWDFGEEAPTDPMWTGRAARVGNAFNRQSWAPSSPLLLTQLEAEGGNGSEVALIDLSVSPPARHVLFVFPELQDELAWLTDDVFVMGNLESIPGAGEQFKQWLIRIGDDGRPQPMFEISGYRQPQNAEATTIHYSILTPEGTQLVVRDEAREPVMECTIPKVPVSGRLAAQAYDAARSGLVVQHSLNAERVFAEQWWFPYSEGSFGEPANIDARGEITYGSFQPVLAEPSTHE
jgi:hypothetical protein